VTNEQMYDWYFEEHDPHWVKFESGYLRRFDQWPPRKLEAVSLEGGVGLYCNFVIHQEKGR